MFASSGSAERWQRQLRALQPLQNHLSEANYLRARLGDADRAVARAEQHRNNIRSAYEKACAAAGLKPCA